MKKKINKCIYCKERKLNKKILRSLGFDLSGKTPLIPQIITMACTVALLKKVMEARFNEKEKDIKR